MASTSTTEDDKDKGVQKERNIAKRSLNMDELRELADLVDERGFTDFEFENEKIRVRLSKNVITSPASTPSNQTAQISTNAAAAAPQVRENVNALTSAAVGKTSSATADEETSEADEGLHKITSPIVGTFYRSPAPDKPAYVKKGDKISEDSVVCIVEAMKLMNEIQAEVSGEIVKVYVEDAQPVEFGQPLFGIRQ